jgi:hypothetical protein
MAKELQPGEEYLSVQLDAKEMLWKAMQALQKNEEKIYTAAFRNDQREQGDNKPIYKSESVAIWKARKKDNSEKQNAEKPAEEEVAE